MAVNPVELKRYLTKRRALENKKFQLKQQFERIDHKIDVVDPMIEDAKSILVTEQLPVIELDY